MKVTAGHFHPMSHSQWETINVGHLTNCLSFWRFPINQQLEKTTDRENPLAHSAVFQGATTNLIKLIMLMLAFNNFLANMSVCLLPVSETCAFPDHIWKLISYQTSCFSLKYGPMSLQIKLSRVFTAANQSGSSEMITVSNCNTFELPTQWWCDVRGKWPQREYGGWCVCWL